MVMFIFKLFLVILMARKIVKKLFVEYKKKHFIVLLFVFIINT